LTSEQTTGELRGQKAIGINGPTVRWQCTYDAPQGQVTVEQTAAYCAPHQVLSRE
jgi:hypothetical protein